MADSHEGTRRDRSDRTVVVAVVGVVVLQVVLFFVMRATSSTESSDPFDSPLYGWTWFAFPAVAFALGALLPQAPSWIWAAAMLGPMAIEVALLGTLGHDPDDGASLWIAGEVFVLVQALTVRLAGAAGKNLRERLDPSPTRRG